MPDDIKVLQATGDDTTAPPVATDYINLKHYQKIKVGHGVDGVFNETSDTDGQRIPVGGAQIGAINETAPASDIANAGLNGRLQRIAQRLTSLIGQLPATLGQKTMANGLAVTVASDQSAIPVTANAGTNLNTSALLTDAAHAARNGFTTDTPPATDTDPASLNGRLQRIAQRITSLMALTGLRREATIQMSVASGGTTASFVDTAGYSNMGLFVPTTFDGTQIQWQGSYNGSVVADLYDITNQPVIMTVTAGRGYDLPGELSAWRWIRVVCLTAQSTTNTDFQLVLRS